jgi:signal transduction histidine kinase
MLATASHELRSPLARMRMALELLKREDRPDLREQLEKDISELDDLVGEILLATRMQTVEELERNNPIDMLSLLEQEAPHYAATIAPEREANESVTVHGDERLLRRLVRNLLDNARRHADKGNVEVAVSTDANGTIVLRVDDDGPGVAESERERIFEPFYRSPGARETGEGFGLGLSLVRQIVQRHGGQVRCLERPGGGTRFEVAFPANDAQALSHSPLARG